MPTTKKRGPRAADVKRWVEDANMIRPPNRGGAALRESYTIPKRRAMEMLSKWGLGLDGLPLAVGVR